MRNQPEVMFQREETDFIQNHSEDNESMDLIYQLQCSIYFLNEYFRIVFPP
jgi:hypothetical protein